MFLYELNSHSYAYSRFAHRYLTILELLKVNIARTACRDTAHGDVLLTIGRLRVAALASGPSQQQTTSLATYGFYLDFVDTFVGKCNGVQARRGGRGRGEPTIIYIKEIIRFKETKKRRGGAKSK